MAETYGYMNSLHHKNENKKADHRELWTDELVNTELSERSTVSLQINAYSFCIGVAVDSDISAILITNSY